MSASGRTDKADSLTALYRNAIRRHAAEPVGYGAGLTATHAHEKYNALCGDRVEIRLNIEGENITGAGFTGEACAICTASASMLCSLAPGATVAHLRQWAADLAKALPPPVGAASAANISAVTTANGDSRNRAHQGDTPSLPQDLRALLGVRPYPSRIRCATLPWEAATAALDEV